MSKRNAAWAGALLLLAACGSREPAPADNAVAAGTNGQEAASPADPAPPDPALNSSADPVPPPDAVSHPDGYLPPAPAEPGPAGSNSSAPATEDEYLRNRQSGR